MWVVMLLLAGIYVQVSIWFLWPYKTVRVLNTPTPITNQDGKVRAGTSLNMHLICEKFVTGRAEVSRSLIDGCVVNVYSGYSDLEPGEMDHIVSVFIPAWVPPGRYKLRTTYKYDVNPIRAISYTYESQYFEVVK